VFRVEIKPYIDKFELCRDRLSLYNNFTSPQFSRIIKVLSEQAGGGPLHKRHNTQTQIMKHIAQDA